MPILKVSLPNGTEHVHELTEQVITIGRVSDNVLQIDDASVSSHHAQLTLKNEHYFLTDLDSTNGTRVNGQHFKEWQMEEGDNVRFGKVDAIFASEVGKAVRPLPVDEGHQLVAAESSHRPADFANASPFKTKKKKRDPAGAGIMALAVVSMLTFGYAAYQIYLLQPAQ